MKNNIDLAKGWFSKASNDLNAAEMLLSSNCCFDACCFHAQQAIEKTLKAFLAYHRREIPRTHDLELLQKLCLEMQDIPSLRNIDLSQTTDYAVMLRYDIEFWPDLTAAEEAIRLTKIVMETLMSVTNSFQ